MASSLLKNDFVLKNIDLIAGIIFGIAMQRGRVHETSLIVGQMTFTHFVMLKMFLSALGTSMIVASYYFKSVTPDVMEQSWNKPRTPYETMIGAAILGIGMTISGSCPGSVFPQIGALSISALFVFLGGIIGTVLFYYYQKISSGNRIGAQLDTSNNALHKLVNKYFNKTYTASEFAFACGSVLLVAVFLLELLVPWKDDLADLYVNNAISKDNLTNSINIRSLLSGWNSQPPIISGIMIGIAQYLLTMGINKRLGCTMSYESYICKAYHAIRDINHEHSKKVCTTFEQQLPSTALERNDHSQLYSTIGMIIGAFSSSLFGWSWYIGNNAHGFHSISPFRSLIGGIFIVFGSRFAMGCTSGHGLSGCGFLSTTSALAVCSMFGSAIITGIVFKVIGI